MRNKSSMNEKLAQDQLFSMSAEGSKLQRLANNRIYPDRIVRRLSDRLSVVFLLIAVEPGNSGPTSPFYIMENKVWNELVDAFLEDQLGAAQGLTPGLAQRRTARQNQAGSWPVFSITAQEAQEFAHWLVPSTTPKLRGDLPTREQWDKAAGFYDRQSEDSEHDDRGPFLRGWSENAMGEMAIRRAGPLPVGAATKDLSRFGCRDMAGNGMEWTRPREKHTGYVDLRGRKFRDSHPFWFTERDTESERCDKAQSWIGFRLVIEGL
jgi:Sulfatase-modifying factor enzyme 1